MVSRQPWSLGTGKYCARQCIMMPLKSKSSLAPIVTTTSLTSYLAAVSASLTSCLGSPKSPLPEPVILASSGSLTRSPVWAPEQARSIGVTPGMSVTKISDLGCRWQ